MLDLGLSHAEHRQFMEAMQSTHDARTQVEILDRTSRSSASWMQAVVSGAVDVDDSQPVSRSLTLELGRPRQALQLRPGRARRLLGLRRQLHQGQARSLRHGDEPLGRRADVHRPHLEGRARRSLRHDHGAGQGEPRARARVRVEAAAHPQGASGGRCDPRRAGAHGRAALRLPEVQAADEEEDQPRPHVRSTGRWRPTSPSPSTVSSSTMGAVAVGSGLTRTTRSSTSSTARTATSPRGP